MVRKATGLRQQEHTLAVVMYDTARRFSNRSQCGLNDVTFREVEHRPNKRASTKTRAQSRLKPYRPLTDRAFRSFSRCCYPSGLSQRTTPTISHLRNASQPKRKPVPFLDTARHPPNQNTSLPSMPNNNALNTIAGTHCPEVGKNRPRYTRISIYAANYCVSHSRRKA
jgi:hypothetical protein